MQRRPWYFAQAARVGACYMHDGELGICLLSLLDFECLEREHLCIWNWMFLQLNAVYMTLQEMLWFSVGVREPPSSGYLND